MVWAEPLSSAACRSQAASGWVCSTSGVWTWAAIVKPRSGATSGTGRFWAEAETARLMKEIAVRAAWSPFRFAMHKLVAFETVFDDMVFLRQRAAARFNRWCWMCLCRDRRGRHRIRVVELPCFRCSLLMARAGRKTSQLFLRRCARPTRFLQQIQQGQIPLDDDAV